MLRILVQIFFAFFAFFTFILAITLHHDWSIRPDNLMLYFNIPSFLLVFGLTVPLTFMTYPIHVVLRAYGTSLKALNKEHALSSSDLREAEMVLELIRRLYIGTGMLGFLIGMVNMLANMDDPRQIGPAMAVAYLSLMYGVIFAEFMTHPLIKRIQFRQTLEISSSKQGGQILSDVLTFAFAATLSVFVLLMSFASLP